VGVYRAVWQANLARTYVLQIALSGTVIRACSTCENVGVSVLLIPGANDVSQWVASGPGVSAPVNVSEVASFTLQPRDSFSNNRESPGFESTLQITMRVRSGDDANPIINLLITTVSYSVATGLYTVSFTPTSVGTITTEILVSASGGVDVGFTAIKGSPYTAVVVGKQVDPAVSVLSGPGLSGALVGIPTYILVMLRDEDGRLVQDSALQDNIDFTVTPSAAGVLNSIIPEAGSGGVYRISYTLFTASSTTITILYTENADFANALQVGSSPLVITPAQNAAPIDLARTQISGSGLTGVLAGTRAELVISLADANGVSVRPTAALQEPGVVRIEVLDALGQQPYSSSYNVTYNEEKNEFSAQYTATTVGLYSLNVIVSTETFEFTPVTVRAGPYSVTTSTLFMTPGVQFPPESLLTATYTLKDAFGNPILIVPTSRARFYVLYTGPAAEVQEAMTLSLNDDGSIFYSFSLIVTQSGSYSFFLVKEDPVTLVRTDITPGARILITVVAGSPLLSTSVASGSAINFLSVTQTGEIRVQLFDTFGNMVRTHSPFLYPFPF
jgi:hypothetical protein